MKKDRRHENLGRAANMVPNERDLHVLNALKNGYSQAEIGRVYGMSRQYVHAIKKRWPKFGAMAKPKLKKT